jgi:predicted TIM-barrel enzyme
MRLIGMVHVAPLPGSPRWDGSMDRVVAAAVADARALIEGGMDALLIENHGDAPFTPGRVEAATVAALAVVAREVRAALPGTTLGINVLKNDARSALAVACAVGARFIRVNVHADVGGKHATPLAPVDLEQHARDLRHRGLADGLVVSGPATGAATDLADIKRVRGAVPNVPILVGSGATPDTAAELLSIADGLIVGTSLKRNGDVTAPVDPERVRRLVAAAR